VRRSGRAAAREPGRAPPAPGATSGEVSELERRRRHDTRQQQTAAPPPTPKAEYENRSSPNRRPDPATLPSNYSSLPPTCLLSRRLDSSPRSAHPPRPAYLIPVAPIPPAAAPPEATPASRLGWPVQVYLDRRGRGSGAKRRTPFLQEPMREAKETPEGGAAACCAQRETHRAKQMEGNTRRETGPQGTGQGMRARGLAGIR
jgi:hypothetical protein